MARVRSRAQVIRARILLLLSLLLLRPLGWPRRCRCPSRGHTGIQADVPAMAPLVSRLALLLRLCVVRVLVLFPSFHFLSVMSFLCFYVSFCVLHVCFLFSFLFFNGFFVQLDHPFTHRHHPQQVRPHALPPTSFSPARRLYASAPWKLCARHADHTRQHMVCVSCKNMAYLSYWGMQSHGG